MHTYTITNTISGLVMGTYEAADAAGALDAAARDAGYADYRSAQDAAPTRVGEIVVRDVTAYTAASKKFGRVEHGRQMLALTCQAYPDNHGTDGGVRYRASAIDEAGNVYRVEWDTTPEWDAVEEAYRADPGNYEAPSDESDACDWSSPVSVVQVA